MKNIEGIQDPRLYFDSGTRWSDRIARLALPILLAAAKNNEPIPYGKLATRLNVLHAEPIPKSFRNYGWPPGKIGHSLDRLSALWKVRIPPLGAIVVNNNSKLPGEGAYTFIQKVLAGAIHPR